MATNDDNCKCGCNLKSELVYYFIDCLVSLIIGYAISKYIQHRNNQQQIDDHQQNNITIETETTAKV